MKRVDSNLRRLRSNLRRHPAALTALSDLGIEEGTAETFCLGLREPYARTDGRVVEGVLSYALSVSDGRRRFGCVTLPGVTSHAEHRLAWSPGRPATVRWRLGAGMMIVCGSPVELWQLGQAAERAGLEATLVASSRPDAAPAEWSGDCFWAGTERVVLTDAVSTAVRRLVQARAGVPVEHAPGVECAQDVERSPAERHDEWLSELLSQTVRCVSSGRTVGDVAGDFAADALPVHGGFAGGMLLHPFQVERRTEEPGELGGAPRLLYSVETLMLRADGAVLEARALPAPRGTPAARRVYALSDGTRVDGPPRAARQGSWSLPSIRAFIAARATGDDPCARTAEEVFGDVRAFLASRVVLPEPADLHVVAAFIVMTHMFRAFQALPVLRVVGPKASGKSELGAAVAEIARNGCVMGQGSAAALVRLAGETGGLVVLDDAETLSTEAGGFGELSQCLKTGYKMSTARKPVVVGGRIEVFDFYGPRLITATRDADPILESRSVTIRTATVASVSMAACDVDPASLRDELHVLAMARAGEVARSYSSLLAARSGRDDEIGAPLLAIAAALGDEPMRAALGARLLRPDRAACPVDRSDIDPSERSAFGAYG